MPSQLPAALLLIEDEPVAFLKKFKASRKDKWKLTRVQMLYDASELMYFLLALNRPAEAVAIGDWVRAGVRFANDYDIWTPAALCFSALYHAKLRMGDPEGAIDAMEPLREHGSHAGGSRWYLEQLPEQDANLWLVEDGLAEGLSESRSLIRGALRTVLKLQAQWECGIGGEIEYPREKVDALRERALRMYALLAEPKSYSAYVKGRQQPALPAASPLSSVGETNKALLKFKKEREGKWRFDSGPMADDAASLAAMLDALDRTPEALAVSDHALASLAITGPYHYWSNLPITQAYLHARQGNWEMARQTLLPLVEHPHLIVPRTPAGLIDPYNSIGGVATLVRNIRDGSLAGRPQTLRGHLLSLYPGVMDTWLRAKLNYPNTDWLPLPVIEAHLAACKNLLRDLL